MAPYTKAQRRVALEANLLELGMEIVEEDDLFDDEHDEYEWWDDLPMEVAATA